MMDRDTLEPFDLADRLPVLKILGMALAAVAAARFATVFSSGGLASDLILQVSDTLLGVDGLLERIYGWINRPEQPFWVAYYQLGYAAIAPLLSGTIEPWYRGLLADARVSPRSQIGALIGRMLFTVATILFLGWIYAIFVAFWPLLVVIVLCSDAYEHGIEREIFDRIQRETSEVMALAICAFGATMLLDWLSTLIL